MAKGRRATKHLRADGEPKDGFATVESATWHKWHIVEKTGTSPDGLRAYRCDEGSDACWQWHVGHYDPRGREFDRWKRKRRS